MKFHEVLGAILMIVVIIGFVLAFASLPFAFVGWIILSVTDIFMAIDVTYFNSMMTGLVLSIAMAVIVTFIEAARK